MTTKPMLRPVFGANAREPQPTFRYVVDIDNQRVGAFLDCKLPTLQWKTIEIKEGGLNDYTHELIERRKKAKLILKRGVGVTTHLLDWYSDTLQLNIVRKQVSISMLDHGLNTVVKWVFEDTYPIKWQGPKLQSKAKAIAIETLTLSCGRMTVQAGDEYK